jgi:hypothetical protein
MTACSAVVLLVDDDILSVARWPVLRECGFTVFEASNGDDGGDVRSRYRKPGAVANMLVYRNRKSAGKRVVWVSASLLSLVS